MQWQTDAGNSRTELSNQLAEDPRRAPLEKETAFHLPGDDTHFEATSFRKVVFAKLLQRPEFEVKYLNVLGDDRQTRTVECFDKVADSEAVIGLTGRLPVGAVTIGTPRNSNSHADIVKTD